VRPDCRNEHGFDCRATIENLLANGSTQKFIAQRYHTTEARGDA